MLSFFVPDDLRAFLRSVVADLDASPGTRLVDAEDAFQDECGYGGRIAAGTYRFHYLTQDGLHRWTMVLAEHELRAIADGVQTEAEGECFDLARGNRPATGDPLLIWGTQDDDALTVRSLDDLIAALEMLRVCAKREPRVVRVWSPSDDQLVAVLWREHAALYVLESPDGYGTSSGESRRTDAFEARDHDGSSLTVPWADCVAWPVALRAMIRFAAHGDLGAEITVEGRIPSSLLMHGELDRQTVLAIRGQPPRDPRRSSLARLTAAAVPVVVLDDATTPVALARPGTADLTAWGRRLVQLLFERALIELTDAPSIDEISRQLSGLLQAHGEEAERSIDTAEWLASELGAIRGVRAMFATGGDLQLALRRARANP